MISITTGIIDIDAKGQNGRGTVYSMTVDAGDGKPVTYEYGLLEILNGSFNREAILAPLKKKADEIRAARESDEKTKKASALQDRVAAVGDDPTLIAIIKEILPAHGKAVAQFKVGNEKAINAIVGAIMKKHGQKYDALVIITLLKKIISSS